MKTKDFARAIQDYYPSVPMEFIRFHLENLSPRYFETFSTSEIANQVERLYLLNQENPCAFLYTPPKRGRVQITVLAYDYPGEFSIITGILSSTGFNILSGDIFTYKPEKQVKEGRKRIIDRFIGKLPKGQSFEQWRKQFQDTLLPLVRLLERDTQNNLAKVKGRTNELVSISLSSYTGEAETPKPVQLSVEKIEENLTKMVVISEDTPFFLYTLSNALSLHQVQIERVHIRTLGKKIEDEFYFSHPGGSSLREQKIIEKIQLSVIFTKQFTYYLWKAPDPYQALIRFEELMQRSFSLESEETWKTILTSPKILKDLAQLLGASDFLWEDFIRLQYETILPLLIPDGKSQYFSTPEEELSEKLQRELSVISGNDEGAVRRKKEILNEFKNREIFLIDLDHIINAEEKLLFLSRRLTALAEGIIQAALQIATDKLTALYGTPRTSAGLPARCALFGLGKFGGAALGYASDIELLFIYSDHGKTDGEESLSNTDFYEKLIKELTGLIEAKQKGIFQIDLRLRPYGKGGPLACSLDAFCSYYGPGGPSHSYERLALVRMRTVGGDATFGEQVERLRDEFIYRSNAIDHKELQVLRAKQLAEKSPGEGLNVKFSPGALVDIEYSVQILQCLLGKNHPELRTSRIHIALENLAALGVLDKTEAEELVEAYYFFRRLLNGLRMLRDSALDLSLPAMDSPEYLHLARRIGYLPKEGLSETKILNLEFETRTAFVRRFVEKYLGRESIPGPAVINAADLILSREIPLDTRENFLRSLGFSQPDRVLANLGFIREQAPDNIQLARLVILAFNILRQTADPDMALNNWERYIRILKDPSEHFRRLMDQPMGIEILLTLFSSSQFLADTLIASPDLFGWICSPTLLSRGRTRQEVTETLRKAISSVETLPDLEKPFRQIRKREILRIGTRDFLGIPLPDITLELSNVAEAFLEIALKRIQEDFAASAGIDLQDLTVLAFGKLGGRELNYSSDIDLLFLREEGKENSINHYNRAVLTLQNLLQSLTEEGFVYRVDFRLRPYGRAGLLVPPWRTAVRYYREKADLWEIQSLLKLRPVAGNHQIAEAFMEETRKILREKRDPEKIRREIGRMRTKTLDNLNSHTSRGSMNIKLGEGGIRDLEFLVQGLQMIHAWEDPGILTGNTLQALHLMDEKAVLPSEIVEFLLETYNFFRKTEHILQLFEDLQTHEISSKREEQEALAKRQKMTYRDFSTRLKREMESVRSLFLRFIEGDLP